MDKTLKNIAWRCTLAVFFLMTLVGWLCGQEPAVCAWRGLCGAVMMYVVVRVAGTIIFGIVIDAMARSEADKMRYKE
jgi:hypothetical protein